MKIYIASVLVLCACGEVNPIVCGDGKVQGTEQCDEGVSNGLTGTCCTTSCTFAAAGVTCREAVGVCDVAETCSGATGACPTDIVAADGTPCSGGNGVGVCSLADTCSAGACANNNKPAGTACGSGACRLEVCAADGSCPAFVAKNIAIVDSSTVTASENMDLHWKTVADQLGHASTIIPLSQLANLATYDILIVSSSTQTETQAQRDTITAFVNSGRGAYVQGEFQQTYQGNITFKQITDTNGTIFTWGPDITTMFSSLCGVGRRCDA